ncbi:MAG: hypothetical protein ABSB53_07405 [Nitrososphaerales archaeon]|jgi:hypothetical protein
MRNPRHVVRSVRLVGLAVFLYGFIVFADEGAGEFWAHGNAFVISPFIWGSSWGFPHSGFAAFEGLLIALTGFFVLSLRESDVLNEVDMTSTLFWALIDTLILFFTWCLAWTLLVLKIEPAFMTLQVTQFIRSTGFEVSNIFVMYFSAVTLVLLFAFRLGSILIERGILSVNLSRRSTLGIGLLVLALGVVIFGIAFNYSNPLRLMDVAGKGPNAYISCSEACYSRFELAFSEWLSAALLTLVGTIISVECLFPREARPV